jgi:hypothetical protein
MTNGRLVVSVVSRDKVSRLLEKHRDDTKCHLIFVLINGGRADTDYSLLTDIHELIYALFGL